MSIRRLVSILLLSPALAFAQLGANTVTVAVSQVADASYQAVFLVSVRAPLDRGLDDVVKALAGTGITAGDLISVQTDTGVRTTLLPAPPTGIVWTFPLSVPLTKIQDTTASLTAVRKTIAQNNGGMSLDFSLQSVNAPAQPQSCDFGRMIGDARNRAEGLALAAGFGTGRIIGMSSNAGSLTGCFLSVTFGLRGPSQPAPNAVTVNASRAVNAPPDQALIGLAVGSGLTAGLDDVTRALASAGVTGAAFSGVSNFSDNPSLPLRWSFNLTAPLSKLKDTLAQLAMAQQTIRKQGSNLSLSFSLEGFQASPQSQQPCPQAGLISDAKAQAQQLVIAAGLSLGPILSLLDANQAVGAIPTAAFRIGAFTSGIFAPGPGSIGPASFLLGSFAPPYTAASQCSLSVQFQLQ